MTWYAADDADAPDDPRAWAQELAGATPRAGSSTATIRDELRALTPSTFRRERLNLWADAADEWLPPGVWARQGGPAPATIAGRVVLGVESEPGWRRATIAVAIAAPRRAAVRRASPPSSSRRRARRSRRRELLEALERVRASPTRRRSSCGRAPRPSPRISTRGRSSRTSRRSRSRRPISAKRPSCSAPSSSARASSTPTIRVLDVQARRARPSGPLEAGAGTSPCASPAARSTGSAAAVWAAWGALSPELAEPQAEIF